jgi:DDE superfamily endonuclease/Helix-turn-helix of DDE superfamily endonuclease
MNFLDRLVEKPKIFQRTVGVALDQFNVLLNRLDEIWEQAEIKRKTQKIRKRKVGGGRPYIFVSNKEKLLATLLYYKAYLTQEFIGILLKIDQSSISRLLQKMNPLIEQIADPELANYIETIQKSDQKQRVNNWVDFIKMYPDLKDISIDATEQQCFRSKNYENQKKAYSGKKKRHTQKTQITTSSTGRILDVSKTYPGSVHDKTILNKEKTILKFPKKTCQRLDLGYQGVLKEYPGYYLILPLKKPRNQKLSQLAKDFNRAHSKRRVVVENALSRIKKFRICGNLYRGPIPKYNQIFRNVAALVNFKLVSNCKTI